MSLDDNGKQPEMKRRANDGRQGEHFASPRRQRGQPLNNDVVNRIGNRDLAGSRPINCLIELASGRKVVDEFTGEKRISGTLAANHLGDGCDPGNRCLRHHRRHHLGNVGLAQGGEVNNRRPYLSGERPHGVRCVEVGFPAGGHNQQTLVVVGSANQMTQQQYGRLCGPVEIVEDEHKGMRPGEPADQGSNGIEEFKPGCDRLRFAETRFASRE